MGWFFTITDGMRKMGLSGNELLVFALVNTYSQMAQGCYFGSLEYTCDCCGISRATAIRTLKSLVEKGFIGKKKIVLGDKMQIAFISVSICDTQSQNDTSGGLKMTPNNKDIYINNTLSNKGNAFHKPTLEEVSAYCASRGNKVNPEQFYDFYESNGWKVGKNAMKDWRAAVRTWEKREKEVAPRKRERKETPLEHNLRLMDQLYGTNLHEQAYGGQADEQ